MEQTSKLSIVVDTRTAEGQLKAFRQSLREVQKYGNDMDKSLSKIGSKTQFAGIISSLKAAQSNLQAFSGTAKNSASALNEFNAVAKSLQTSTKSISNNLNSAQTAMTKFANGSKAISTNLQGANTGIAQTQTNLMKIIGSFNFASNASGKLSASAKTLKADIAALNAALVTGSGALGRFGQASNAAGAASNNARARNTELANSYRLVNTGLQSNAQYLQQANRAMAANSSAAVAAKLNQDKLAISSSKVATASSRAAEAAARAQIAVANLATASSRAASAISDEASAASRAAAANSNAAAAATRAESATSSLASANSRAAAASSGAAAAASRAAGANSSAAAAASRAAAAVSGEAAARERALAAASRTAAAAANAAAAQDRAAAAAVRLASAEARAAAEADRLAGGLGRANGQAHGFMGTLNSLQGLLMGGMFSIATLGVIKTADEMQNLNSQIKLVTKSEEEYLGIRQKVREIADANFNDVKATTGLYANSARALANLGKSQAEALEFTNAVSLAMRAGGRSTQEQASAIMQLGQAMGANVVQGDEFRSIAENAPILLDLVSKRMGVLPGQLKALAADGKITGEVMFDALTQNVNILEEMAKKMPLTMAQAFTVAKNRYKSYVDDMMNQTGGMSGKIASMINGISGNFDTLAKVAIAGVTLAFAQMALSIGSASTAMAIFNAVAGLNPLVLIAGAFIAVNSAIFGVNDVLSISGMMLGDFFGGMSTMLKDGETWWMNFSDTVAVAMGITVKDVANANDKNTKNFLGFYTQTEKGFAGVVQGLGTAIGSVTAIFGTFFELLGRWSDNMFTTFDNMGKAAYNAGNRVRMLFGGDDQQQEYGSLKSLDGWSIYKNTFNANQDSARDYARSLNERNSARKSVPVPYAPSTSPMDEIKKSQFEQMKANDALEEATKAAAKEAKERAKREKKLNGSAKKGGTPVNATVLSQAAKYDYAGLEKQYNLPKGLLAAVSMQESRGVANARGPKTKYGVAKGAFQFLDGTARENGVRNSDNVEQSAQGAAKYLSKLINQFGSVDVGIGAYNAGPGNTKKYGGKIPPFKETQNYVKEVNKYMAYMQGGVDGSVNVADNLSAQHNEQIKAMEAAQRERERIAALNLKLMKEYGDKEAQLTIENDARVAEINESSFNSTKKAELIKESERRMKQELAVYKKGLEDKVNELVKFQKTERDLLKKQYDDEVFSIVSDSELSRPENKAQLTQAIINAQLLNDYRVSLYEQSLEQQKSAMYAFQKTERDVLIDSWDNKLADAELMYDELRDYRLEAIRIEGAQDINTFDTNQALKMLELKKYHMSEIAYIQARDALERKLIDLSNEPQEVKELQKGAMTQAANLKKSDALDSVMDEIKNESPMGRIEADYQRRLEIIDEYESQWTSLVGVHSAERAAIEQSYMDAKRDLMLTQGEALFGDLAGLAKSFAGEQSGIYRALFAVEKGFAIAQSAIAIQQSIAKAMALGFPQNIPVIGQAISQGASIMSSIKGISGEGFKQGGYTGNMGVNQVAGAVHGQEYVFDAQSTKRIGVDNLNAMRRGDSPKGGGDVNINVVVDAKGNASVSGDNERMGRDMANGIKAVVMDTLRKEKRQGGMLYA